MPVQKYPLLSSGGFKYRGENPPHLLVFHRCDPDSDVLLQITASTVGHGQVLNLQLEINPLTTEKKDMFKCNKLTYNITMRLTGSVHRCEYKD